MKKRFVNLLIIILIGGFSISCNDDDDNGPQLGTPETPEIITPESVLSIYHGPLVRIIEQQAGSDVNNVTNSPVVNNIILIREDENTSMLTLKFQNLRFLNTAPISEWKIPNISLMKDGNICHLLGEAQDLALWKNGKIAKVYVSGTIEGDSLHVTVDIKTPGFQGSYGENMNLKFNGKAGHTMGEEAEITAFSVDKPELVNKITMNPDKKEIVILVNKGVADNDLKFNAEIEASEGAFLQAGFYEFAGSLDFTKNQLITIKVSSEDGKIIDVAYKIYCLKIMDLDFTFDSWMKEPSYGKWDIPTGWCTNNMAIYMGSALSGVSLPEYAIQKKDGAALIKTLDTKSYKDFMGTSFKKITSGALYNGTFANENITSFGDNKLGVLYKSQPKPLKFQGSYSYTAGTTVYDQAGNEVPEAADECLLAAYLYEVAKESETLDAVSIRTSGKVVAKAEVTHGTTSAQENFDVPVTFNPNYEYDPAKMYKLAILLISSKDGHIYKGAPGSTLIVDKVSVVAE